MTTSWASLDELRTFLQFDDEDTSDNAALQRQLDSACSVIEGIKGRIGQEVLTNEVQPVQRLGLVLLDETPIVSVEQVRLVSGAGSFVVLGKSDPAAGILGGWKMQSAGGVLSVPVACAGDSSPTSVYVRPGATVLVDYTTGLDPVPPNYTQAAIELAGFLWNSSQNNEGGGRTSTGGTDEEWPARASGGIGAYALPFRVRELLGLYGSAVKSQIVAR